MRTFCVWIAQGFGLGKIPFAPGTFGSMGGFIWFIALLLVPSPYFFGGGMLFGIVVSVIASTLAENVLGEKDPGSIVIDEIVAVPLCFVGWLTVLYFQDGKWGELRWAAGPQVWLKAFAIIVLFRFFDIAKPWPVRQIQHLPGGWGITVDDLLAAAYVNLCVLAALGGARLMKAEN